MKIWSIFFSIAWIMAGDQLWHGRPDFFSPVERSLGVSQQYQGKGFFSSNNVLKFP